MEATPPYPERPPKRKRESSPSRSGPADKTRGAAPAQPRNQDPAQLEPPTHNKRMASAAKSFRPLARKLECLDEKNPILAAQAALLEPYVAKNAESQRFNKENQQLKDANASLSEERKQAACRSLGYDALLSYYKEAHQRIEEGIIGVLENWKEPRIDTVYAGKEKQDA